MTRAQAFVHAPMKSTKLGCRLGNDFQAGIRLANGEVPRENRGKHRNHRKPTIFLLEGGGRGRGGRKELIFLFSDSLKSVA